MKKSLVIVRAGVNSLHNAWVERKTPRSWDLYVCPYQATPFESEPEFGIYVGDVFPGPKWGGLRTLLHSYHAWREYDYILLADDDLFALESIWSEFFQCCRTQDAKLAQPAISRGSSMSHLMTLENPNFSVRKVGFVEIMMPCFRSDISIDLLHTLSLTESGWGFGLDILWPHLLGHEDIIISDSTPVFHSRPAGSARNSDLNRKNDAEIRSIHARFGASWMKKSFGGRLLDGRNLAWDEKEFMQQYISGYWDVIKTSPLRMAELIGWQTGMHFKE